MDYFDSESNKKKMAARNIKVVESFKEEDDSLVVASRVSRLFKHYTEEIMKEIKLKKQMDVKRVDIQEIGMTLNLFIHCKSPEDAEEFANEDLDLCN